MRRSLLGKIVGLLVSLIVFGSSGVSGSTPNLTIWWSALNTDSIASYVEHELIPAFEAQENVNVIFIRMNYNDVWRQFAAGRGPDIVLTLNDLGLYWAEYGYLIPLDFYFERWADKESIPPWLLRRAEDNGRVYALPFHNDFRGVYAYHQEVFAANGVDPVSASMSWEDLLSAVQKTTQLIDGQVVRGLDMLSWTEERVFDTFLYQNEGRKWSTDYRSVLLADEKSVETARFLADLLEASYPLEPEARLQERIAWGALRNRLVNGEVATLWGNRTLADELFRERADDVSYFVGRRSPATQPVVLAEPTGIGITRFVNDETLAWKFIEWFFSPEITVSFHEYTGSLVTRLDLHEQVWERQPYYLPIYEFATHARLSPQLLPRLAMAANFGWNEVEPILAEILKGNVDTEQALTRVQDSWQRRLSDAWRGTN